MFMVSAARVDFSDLANPEGVTGTTETRDGEMEVTQGDLCVVLSFGDINDDRKLLERSWLIRMRAR